MRVYKAALLLSLAMMGSSAHAFVMPDSGSSLVIDQGEALYVNDGDVFNFSSVSITSTGGLNIYGNSQNVSFSIIASDTFNIAGYLNLFVTHTYFAATDFSLAGVINIAEGGSLSIFAENSLQISGMVHVEGVPLPPSGGPNLQLPIFSPSVIAASVPEPENYAFMLAGLGLVASIVRRHLA